MAYLDHINCAHLRSLILKSKIITLHRLFTVQEAFLAIEYSILRVGAVEIFNKDYETYVSVLRPVKQLQINEKRKCVNKLITLAHDVMTSRITKLRFLTQDKNVPIVINDLL